MTSVERRPCRGRANCRGAPRLWSAVLVLAALVGLGACAGPTPDISSQASDASAPAAASAEGSATNSNVAAAAAAAAQTPTGEMDTSDADAAASERAAAPPPAESAPDETADVGAPESDTPPAEAEAPPPPAPEAPPVEAVPSVAETSIDDTSMSGPPGSGLATGRPYVVIRFAEDAGDYEPALAEAVRLALARRPNVAFDLVAVTPRASTAEELADDAARARAQAAAVMQSLADLGIGSERVNMRAWTGQPTDVNEIRLYIR